MRAVGCIALVAAFATAGCAATQDGAALIQAVQSSTSAGNAVAVSMSPTEARDLLYISLVYAGPSYPAPRVSTAAGLARPLDWTTMTTCSATTYDWVVPSTAAGTTAVTVDLPMATPSQLFVLELAGVSQELEAAPDATGTDEDSTARAAPVDAAPGQVVISTVSTCGTVTSIAAGNPFTTFGGTPRGDVAYDVPAAAGSYGASWKLAAGDVWQARTTSFH